MKIKSTAFGLAAAAIILSLSADKSLAYPYYGGGYYAPAYTAYSWPPSGAALGPWPWNFDIGGGPTPLINGSHSGFTNGGNFTVGGGYNFTPRTGLVFEFSQSWLGLTDQTLQQNQADSGDATIWSITLNPIWRYRIGGPVGGYIIGGGGYYERDERFTEPVTLQVQTFHGSFDVPGEETVHNIDGTGGLNIGTGLTFNMGWGTKLFVEVRYHYIFTSGTPTQIIPVTIGFRW